ncbi:MAG: undecaprenyl-diphosphate phosphatase [Chloroflexi bacterium]|nr:undecaprenyl-diphosphate phosphatase [Chloroflexota bacterium]
MIESALLGLLQGLTEWLPVSSQGVVTAASAFLFDYDASDAVAVALWLHVGTSLAAVVAFRREVAGIARELLRDPMHPSPLLAFLAVGTVVSAVVGLPLLLLLDDLSGAFGAGAMALVGALMVATGAVQVRRPISGTRDRTGLSLLDAVLTGLAQGLAALPGLSRSGLTVAVLLGRRVERSEALVLSFLLGIPAGLAAALFAGLDSGVLRTAEGLAGAAVAFVVGLASIKVLLALARRVNLAFFVALVGVAVIGGAVFEAVAG